MNVVFGVDPGKSGAIAAVHADTGELLGAWDMPVVGNIISAALLSQAVTAWPEGTAVIEDVHAMPKQGVTSSFSFGRSLGVAEGVLAGAGWSLRYVSPAKWKRALGLTADKGSSRRRAIELWPSKADLFKRVKDDGRAEAALIAYWFIHHGEGRSAA